MTTNVLSRVLEVFTAVINWLVTSFESITPMFYSSESGLTFLGVLAVGSLAISVGLLVIGIVQGFLKFRA